MVKPGKYLLKQEFFPMCKITIASWERRREDLLNWLSNFFDYDLIEGKPIYIVIKETYGEYKSIPRKVRKKEEIEKQKEADYEAYVIASLGTEFKPNSKAKIAREAIRDFSADKYYHMDATSVARRYVSKPFNKYGETNDHQVWVYYSNYQPLEQNILDEWHDILREEHISVQEAANAFYREQQGEDISKERGYYKIALSRFQDKYGDTPVLVKEWKVRPAQL